MDNKNNVIPAKAGIQVLNFLLKHVYNLDPGFRRDDGKNHEIHFRLAVVVLLLAATPSFAEVFMNQEEALKMAFPPEANVERISAFLTEEQVSAIEKRAESKLESPLVTYYRGEIDNAPAGYAFFETDLVRTMPETYMVVLSPVGEVKFVEILAFHEPMDYLPRKKWFSFFKKKQLNDSLRVKRDIRNVTGSTLTTRAITGGVRRVLATYEILIKKEQKK